LGTLLPFHFPVDGQIQTVTNSQSRQMEEENQSFPIFPQMNTSPFRSPFKDVANTSMDDFLSSMNELSLTEDALSKESQALELLLSRRSGKNSESQQLEQKWEVLKSLKCWTLAQYRTAVLNGEVNDYKGNNGTAERQYALGWVFNWGSRKWRKVDKLLLNAVPQPACDENQEQMKLSVLHQFKKVKVIETALREKQEAELSRMRQQLQLQAEKARVMDETESKLRQIADKVLLAKVEEDRRLELAKEELQKIEQQRQTLEEKEMKLAKQEAALEVRKILTHQVHPHTLKGRHVAKDVYICIDTNILLRWCVVIWLHQLKQIRLNSNLSVQVLLLAFPQLCIVSVQFSHLTHLLC
jgi:hypothetical protein